MLIYLAYYPHDSNDFVPMIETLEDASHFPEAENADGTALSFNERYRKMKLASVNRAEKAAKEAEEKRRQAWIARFPWEPVVDEDFPYIPEKYLPRYHGDSIEEKIINGQKQNYTALKDLFSNEMRYTAQFEKMCDILSEYDRTEDPVLAKRIFSHLWNHHRYKGRDEEKSRRYARGIVAALTNPRLGDEYYFSKAGRKEAEEIMQVLLSEVLGMETLPKPFPFAEEEIRRRVTFYEAVQSGDPDLVGDFLVPYKGWAQKYEALLRRQKEQSEKHFTLQIPELPPGSPSGPAVMLMPRVDEEGKPVFDEDGRPVFDTVDLGIMGGDEGLPRSPVQRQEP